MTLDEFKATVNHYGEDKVLAIVFDNSGRHVFLGDNKFSIAKNVVESIDSLQFVETDVRGVEYLSVKHIENIQGMIFASPNTDMDKIDSRYLSS